MKAREFWKKGLRCVPAISTWYGSMATVGRHGAAARCFTPTASGFGRFAIGSKTTLREAATRCCNRRRCWKNLLRKTEVLVLSPRKGWQHEHASVSLGEILSSGSRLGNAHPYEQHSRVLRSCCGTLRRAPGDRVQRRRNSLYRDQGASGAGGGRSGSHGRGAGRFGCFVSAERSLSPHQFFCRPAGRRTGCASEPARCTADAAL